MCGNKDVLARVPPFAPPSGWGLTKVHVRYLGETQWAHAYAHRSEPKARKTPQRDRQVASSITHSYFHRLEK